MKTVPLALVVFLVAMPAHAYLGPGMSVGAFAVVLGVVGSVFLGLFSVIYYPIKRLLKKTRSPAASKTTEEQSPEEQGKIQSQEATYEVEK